MYDDKLYEQYLYETSLFEKYGSKNVITFDEWKWIKSAIENVQLTTSPELSATTLTDYCYLKLCRESLGHLSGDKETLI